VSFLATIYLHNLAQIGFNSRREPSRTKPVLTATKKGTDPNGAYLSKIP